MSPRLIAALLAAVLLAPAARAAPEPQPDSSCTAVQFLAFDWFASHFAGTGEVLRAGPAAYSYLPGRTPAPHLGPLRLNQAAFGPVRSPTETAAAEKTYTIVERAGSERFERPLPTAAVLFASALCGIGGLAWWRCQNRGEA